MKALTLWRPWPQAIVHGSKRLENRIWAPPKWIVGKRIALHSGQRYDRDGASWMHCEGLYAPAAPSECPAGVVVGTAIVAGVVTHSKDPWFCGPYGWVLQDVRALSVPVPCRGAQGLWNLPPDVERRVRELEVPHEDLTEKFLPNEQRSEVR